MVSIEDIKKYKSENGTYTIPVEWSVYSTVTVEADNLHDAFEKFQKYMDDLPLCTESEYIDDTYKATVDYPEHPDELLAAQGFYRIGNVTICKDGTILS